jgi:hypothetical protein
MPNPPVRSTRKKFFTDLKMNLKSALAYRTKLSTLGSIFFQAFEPNLNAESARPFYPQKVFHGF